MNLTRTRASAMLGIAGIALSIGSAQVATAATSSDGAALAAAGSTVRSDTAIRYAGLGSAANRLTVSGFGPDRFLLTDTLPIQVGPGCTTRNSGGLFGAVCRAPVNSEGEFLRFFVDLGDGSDTVVNLAPASMSVQGGTGNDVMTGGPLDDDFNDRSGSDTMRGRSGDDLLDTESSGDAVGDVLEGGRGDDDLFSGPGNDQLLGGSGDDGMRAGRGADLIDGGSGRDHVSYTDSDHGGARNFVTFDGVANDGDSPIGGVQEKDNVLSTVEDATGNSGTDFFFGSAADNHLVGLGGDDFLEGNEGDDILDGDSGADVLSSNTNLGALSDGDVDILNGSTDSPDSCRISVADGDRAVDCEIVDPT